MRRRRCTGRSPGSARAVSELERSLGVQLFDRSHHPVSLTAEGRALLPHARGILRHLRAASEEAGRAAHRVRGRVRLGAYSSAAAHLFPLLFERSVTQFPGIELAPWEGATLELEAVLISGDIDLAVRPVLPAADQRFWSSATPAVSR
ncbi:LysR family transcriptional regulator [Saccharopolyspora shandongensis]|uniref:LysR family transcriptional regulator n=1 Tax=Saccharopolyspora shandongensis TaxID=418495 RepID=UPI003401168E